MGRANGIFESGEMRYEGRAGADKEMILGENLA